MLHGCITLPVIRSQHDWIYHFLICSFNVTWRLDLFRHPFSATVLRIRSFNGRNWLFHPFIHSLSLIKWIRLWFIRSMAGSGSLSSLPLLCHPLKIRLVCGTWRNVSCLLDFSGIHLNGPFLTSFFQCHAEAYFIPSSVLSQWLNGSFNYLVIQCHVNTWFILSSILSHSS